MDSNIVSKEINFYIKPFLKKNGIDKWTNRVFGKSFEDRINIIEFQSFNAYNAAILGCTSFSLSIKLSCFLKYIPTETEIKYKNSEPRPREEQGHFRAHITKSIYQPELIRKDIWYINNEGSNLKDIMIDCCQQLEKSGIDWFNQFDSKEKVFNILNNETEDMEHLWGFGNFDSPIRNLYLAFTAIELNKFDFAIDKLKKLSAYYHEQYLKNKFKYYLDHKRIIDNEIEKIHLK